MPDSRQTTRSKFHNHVLDYFRDKTRSRDTARKEMKKFYQKYRTLYDKDTTLRQKLSEVRRIIKQKQSPEIYSDSLLEEYFNLPKANRDALNKKTKERIVKKNKNRIQVDQLELLSTLNKLLLSDNVYDKILALLMASGARPVELLSKNKYELIKDKPSWVKVLNIAKKREDKKDETLERPIIEITPQIFIAEVDNVRKALSRRKIMVKEKNTGKKKLNPAISSELNQRAVKHFPWLTGHWNKSTMLRKIYVDLSWKLFADTKLVGKTVWAGQVLGHGLGDLLTSASYTYVNTTVDENTNLEQVKTKLNEHASILKLIKANLSLPKISEKQNRKRSKWEKIEELERIYKPGMSIRKLKKISGIGTDIVMEFLQNQREKASKMAPDDPDPDSDTENKPIKAPIRRSARLMKKRPDNL